ncbi:MAG: hypothetical protein KAU50_09650, partial [Candidatus Marinimicrobia bacterium]|nr:hypothetical protein [Candidatus Neomarinimicrobiota bacterium]
MKKRTLGIILPAMLILFGSLLPARSKGYNPAQMPAYNLAKAAGTNGPDAAAMTINNFLIFVDRNGLAPLLSTSGVSGDYPIGTAGIIFQEGVVWGARVRDGSDPVIRVNGSTYETGLKAGKVLYDVSGQVTGSEDRTVPHVWRVRRDYATANLTADAGYSLSIAVENVTATHIRTVYDQYDYDWQNWPADQGAPFDDLDNDGTYDPAVDIPGYPGAAQTIWLVTNDLPYFDSDVGYTVDPSTLIYGSPAIGMEIQLTMWAYDFAPDSPLGNAIFRQTRLIYTGLPETPDTARLDSMYIAQWSDPDLGTWTDDFVGCDTLLDLGYVYNSVTTDAAYMNDFGLPVPAAGYTLLKGPIINGDTLGMTTFGYFGAGSISDPNMGHYSGALEWWNRMEGFMPIPSYPTQCPWTDPITGEITKFPLSGDPIAGTGWIDGIIMPPGDKRMYQVTGPFTMALGDTQDVVVALIGAMGNDNISSLAELKKSTQFIRQSYRNNLVLNGFIAQADYDAQDSTSFTLNVSTVSSITTVSAKFR